MSILGVIGQRWVGAFFQKQVVVYGVVGLSAAAMQWLVLALFLRFTLVSPMLANVTGYLMGFVVSFVGHRYWTFSTTNRKTTILVFNFFLVALLNFLVNQFAFYGLFYTIHLHYTVALMIAIGLATMVSFILSKFFVFNA